MRVTDNLSLRSREYVILLKGTELSRYELLPGNELAIPYGSRQDLPGSANQGAAFGLPALWIPTDRGDAARGAGYTVVDAVNSWERTSRRPIRRYAHELFSRQDAKAFCDRVTQDNPKVVEDLVPKLLSLAIVQRVVQNLLRERVSIRDGVSILEALGEAAPTSKNPVLLTEYVRQSIRRAVVKPYLNQKGELPAWLMDACVEQTVENARSAHRAEQHSHTLAAGGSRHPNRIERKVEKPEMPVAVITSSGARYFLRQIVEPSLGNLFFLSHNEVPAGVKVLSLGVI